MNVSHLHSANTAYAQSTDIQQSAFDGALPVLHIFSEMFIYRVTSPGHLSREIINVTNIIHPRFRCGDT
nr:hypothetical protein [Escherichia coli]